MQRTDARLRRWRQQHDMTLQDVADLTGLSVSMISRIETGDRRATALQKVWIAKCLGVGVSDLFDAPEKPAAVEEAS